MQCEQQQPRQEQRRQQRQQQQQQSRPRSYQQAPRLRDFLAGHGAASPGEPAHTPPCEPLEHAAAGAGLEVCKKLILRGALAHVLFGPKSAVVTVYRGHALEAHAFGGVLSVYTRSREHDELPCHGAFERVSFTFLEKGVARLGLTEIDAHCDRPAPGPSCRLQAQPRIGALWSVNSCGREYRHAPEDAPHADSWVMFVARDTFCGERLEVRTKGSVHVVFNQPCRATVPSAAVFASGRSAVDFAFQLLDAKIRTSNEAICTLQGVEKGLKATTRHQSKAILVCGTDPTGPLPPASAKLLCQESSRLILTTAGERVWRFELSNMQIEADHFQGWLVSHLPQWRMLLGGGDHEGENSASLEGDSLTTEEYDYLVERATEEARKRKRADYQITDSDSAGGAIKRATRKCCVCLDNEPDFMVRPCRHACLCAACSVLMKESKQDECPVCKHRIDEIERIYLS